MNGFLAGLITGGLIGAVSTLIVLVILAGSQAPEQSAGSRPPGWDRRMFFMALLLLAVSGACFTAELEKSALVSLLMSVLFIARLGGSMRGLAAAGIAAVMLAWFLPPSGSLWVSGVDNRLTLVLFILGATVGSMLTEGRKWLKRWVEMANPD